MTALEIDARPLHTVPSGNSLGEGVLWSVAEQAFLWTDIVERTFWRLTWPEGKLDRFSLPYRLGSFALTEQAGQIIAAFEQGFARYNYLNGELVWLARPKLPDGVRFNDGRVDRDGRFLAGTMVEAPERANGSFGSLYSLGRDGKTRILLSGISIANTLCWSPDGNTMYHADSASGLLNIYDYAEGWPSNARTLVQHAPGDSPDGATVDADGRLWVAIWGGSRVAIYNPDGSVADLLPLPVSQPTCVAFGGPSLEVLAVTTARQDLSPSQRALEPAAGSLFLFQTNATGLPEAIVRYS